MTKKKQKKYSKHGTPLQTFTLKDVPKEVVYMFNAEAGSSAGKGKTKAEVFEEMVMAYAYSGVSDKRYVDALLSQVRNSMVITEKKKQPL